METSTEKTHASAWQMTRIRYRRLLRTLSPQQNLLYGFAVYSFAGWVLLLLPWSHATPISAIDNLFVATSAISTTGLVPVSVGNDYSWFGQAIILLLIQIGGIGYMTFTSFLLLSSSHRLSNWHHRVLNAEFSLPKGFEIRDFLKSVILFTIVLEVIGALMFYIAFTRAGVDHNIAIWSSVFHSISSFCTAGFGLYDDSFMRFRDDGFINGIISVLALCGSMGFIVVTDLWNRFRGRSAAVTYTTKVIFGVTLLLLFFGTVILYLESDQWMTSFFQSMTALTTVGFNTVPLDALSVTSLLMLLFLMFVGASPAGTGGGVKSTTLTALTAIMWSRIRNSRRVTFFGKQIPLERLYVATSVFMLYSSILLLSTFLLSMVEEFPLHQLLFEVTSAIGTVGLSTGITGQLSDWGKLILTATMFIGRLGVLTFGVAIVARRHEITAKLGETDLAV